MIRGVLLIFIFMSLVIFSGCSTFGDSSYQSLETRVRVLENKVGALTKKAGPQELSPPVGVREAMAPDEKDDVTVENMTKKQVQEALKNAGFYEGEIDGKIGPKTRKAIRDFQGEMGLAADGVAGSKTRKKLLNYL